MKYISTVFSTALLAVALAAPASAESWYVGGYGLLNVTHDGAVNGAGEEAEYDLGYGLGGSVGMHVNPNIRLEGELAYRTNDIDSINGVGVGGDVETTALMFNVFYDISPGQKLNPHLGGGVGLADVDYTAFGNVYDDTVLAFQLGAGADYGLGDNFSLTFDYRLFMTEDMSIGGGAGLGSVEYVNSSFLVGIRKRF